MKIPSKCIILDYWNVWHGWSLIFRPAFTICLPCNTKAQWSLNTGCPRRNVPDFGRVFLMLKYTDITQNTLIQS